MDARATDAWQYIKCQLTRDPRASSHYYNTMIERMTSWRSNDMITARTLHAVTINCHSKLYNRISNGVDRM